MVGNFRTDCYVYCLTHVTNMYINCIHTVTSLTCLGVLGGARDGFARDDDDQTDGDIYPADGPLPSASLRSRTTRHLRVRAIHNYN